MVDSNVWIGVVSDSEIGKHFQWANSEPLLYAQWRLLHPTHHEAGPNEDKIATVLHPYYKAGDDYGNYSLIMRKIFFQILGKKFSNFAKKIFQNL